MDAVGDSPLHTELFPWPDRPGRDLSFRRRLERAEAIHLGAATRFRGLGWEDLAHRAERFAAWARFDLDEPQAARRLYAATGELRGLSRSPSLPGKILDGALSLSGAERGNVQLVNQTDGSLVIVAQCGFGAEFLEYFAIIDDATVCGRAAKRRALTIVTDVTTDPAFAPHRAIAAAAGFRAVQSTPLTDRAGRLVGVVSTHYRDPHSLCSRDRQVMRRYGELAGWALAEHVAPAPDDRAEGRPGAAGSGFLSAARAHSQAADAHQRSIRAGAGDAAEHQRRSAFHRAAAEADRQRAHRAGG